MDDPAKLMGEQLSQHEIAALRSSVKEGQRLLRAAIVQRNVASSEARRQLELRAHERDLLLSVRNSVAFIFLPRWLKAELRRTVL